MQALKKSLCFLSFYKAIEGKSLREKKRKNHLKSTYKHTHTHNVILPLLFNWLKTSNSIKDQSTAQGND